MRGLRIAAVGVASVTAALLGIAVSQEAGLLPEPAEDLAGWLVPFAVVAILAPTVVGLLIALRRPGNRIAWVLLLGPLSIATWPIDLVVGDGWALQVSRATWPLYYAWPIAVAYVFPNGHLLSPRWRWIAGAGMACFAGFIAFAMIDPAPFTGENASVRNPLADSTVAAWLRDAGITPAGRLLWIGILGSLVAGAVAIVLRLRRSTGIERLQAKWLAWAGALVPAGMLLCGLGGLFLYVFGVAIVDSIVLPFVLLVQGAVAAAVGIAVLRYRLYAIDRLVNRTIVYACLTVLLLATYAAPTLALGVLAGRGSAWVTAVSTLAVAIAFRPLRSRLQDLVDRRFSRARYQGVRRVRAFEDEVRDGRRAPEEVTGALAVALGDPLAELRFWLPETGAYADAAGALTPELPRGGRAQREVRRDDTLVAMLLHDPVLCGQRDLLDGVLSAASLSIEIARLRVELRLQLAEVEASRARIVDAGYEERRRLERDLHDGAQQRLVSLGVQIRRIQSSLPAGARVLSPALDQIVAEVGAAIRDLRQIAAGIRPARLDDGLAAALLDLARSSPIPVEVDVPPERFAAGIEAAVYFVACEAVANAIKHGAPSRVAISATRVNGNLHVRISDDGVGGAVVRRGSGLAGLRDRVAAHGGTLDVASPPRGGTSVEMAIPCPS